MYLPGTNCNLTPCKPPETEHIAHFMALSNSSESCHLSNSNYSVSKHSEATSDLKPCCACPDTRKLRDDCVFMKGEENCHEFIEKHKECLRSYGFKV